MKVRAVSILVITASIGMAAFYLGMRHTPSPLPATTPAITKLTAKKAAVSASKPVANTVIEPNHDSIPEKLKTVQRTVIPPKPVQPKPANTQNHPRPSREAQQREAHLQYWKRAADRFNRQWDQLDREQDPGKRDRLIQSMAQYVRLDTPGAIEWAMGLEDPVERNLALEAVNKYALTGIGARIALDDTGYPKIKETTVLSAVASTGMVQPGDYIVGMQDENGHYVSFDGMNVQQIVQHLRGKAGSDVHLFMERTTGQGTESTAFEVPVQRSLIVVQPPY